MDFRPNRLVRVLALNLQRHRQLLPSRKARGKRDRHRRVPRRAVVGQRHDGARPGRRPRGHINNNAAAADKPRRGLGRAAHERRYSRSRRNCDHDAAAERGTAAVGDSGKASISVASTGLVERTGLPGGVSTGLLGGIMLAPGGAWAGCSTNRDESPPPRDLHLVSGAVARQVKWS